MPTKEQMIEALKDNCGGECLLDLEKCECFDSPTREMLDDLGMDLEDWAVLEKKEDCPRYDTMRFYLRREENSTLEQIDSIVTGMCKDRSFTDKETDNIIKGAKECYASTGSYMSYVALSVAGLSIGEGETKAIPTKKTKTIKGWSKLRYEAFKKNGNKCCLCGISPKEGATLHVDHIKPRSRYPELQSDINNLQVLCSVCNESKSNKYEDDWR